MKKISIKLAALVFITLTTSCDKEYKCECVLTDKTTGQKSTNNSYPINSTKKSEAVTKCNSHDEVSASYINECEIK